MERIPVQMVAESVPFEVAVVLALQQLGHEELFNDEESTMGLKVILWLVSKTTIRSFHSEVGAAIREAVLYSPKNDDMNLACLYERTTLHLALQDEAAITMCREEDVSRARTQEREQAIRAKEEALEELRKKLALWDNALVSKEAELNAKAKELAELESKLSRRKKKHKSK